MLFITVWFDAGAELLFLSGGGTKLDGAVAVYSTPPRGGAPGDYALLGTNTPAGKNSMLDERARKLYTTVPSVGGAAAFIQVYAY